GRAAVAFRAFARCLDPVHAAARRLADGVATVRAIDFDGSLARRLEPILEGVHAERRFAEEEAADVPREAGRTVAAVVARALLLTGLYGSAWPLVANFAIDRGTDLVPVPWWPVLPLFIEAAALLFGAYLMRRASAETGRGVAIGGWVVLAIATGAVAWCRS